MRPFLVMDPDERHVVEQVHERAVINRMVRSGAATWIVGRRAVRLVDLEDAPHTLRIVPSGIDGPAVVQRVRQ